MMLTTFDNDFIGLEDFEKKRGLVEFKTQEVDTIRLEIAEIKPKLKTNTQRIIIRDGRSKGTSGKTTELF